MREVTSTRIGLVYQAIAWEVGISKDTKEMAKVVQNGGFEEIEAFVNVVPYIEAQCKELRRLLKEHNVVVPEDLAEILVHGADPWNKLQEMMKQIDDCRISEFDRMRIAVSLMKVVHNEWVKRNSAAFFDFGNSDYKSRFMAFELVGFFGAMDYVWPYVAGFVRFLNWRVNTTAMMTIYCRRQDELVDRYDLNSSESLLEYVQNGGGCELPKEVAEVLKGKSGEILARQMILAWV